ncbi:MAG: M23 family metallopeptidase [Ilumatobacteraceae bacterium]
MHSSPSLRPRRGAAWRRAAATCVAVGLLAAVSAVASGQGTTVRRAAASAAGPSVVAAAARLTAASPAAAEAVEGSASADAPAKRLVRPGALMFPLDPGTRCYVLDNFGDPRSGGRIHEGEDIIANQGALVYAVVDGRLNRQVFADGPSASLSGNAWYLTTAGGSTYYFYAHLAGFAPGLQVGSAVRQGDVIGYVGDTGNAGPNNFHLHFEVHPDGGSAVDPLPLLAVPYGCTVY